MLGYAAVDVKHPDRYPLEVLNQVLSGQGSRIFDNLREEKGLAYYAGSFLFLGVDPGAFIFYVGTVRDKLKLAQRELLAEIRRLQEELISEEELERAKESLIGSRWIEWQRGVNMAAEVAADELLGVGYTEVYEFERKVRQVSREDIRRVARKYLSRPYVAAVVGDVAGLEGEE